MNNTELDTRIKTAVILVLPVVLILFSAIFFVWAKLLASFIALALVIVATIEFTNVSRRDDSNNLHNVAYLISCIVTPLICFLAVVIKQTELCVPLGLVLLIFGLSASISSAAFYAFLQGRSAPDKPALVLQELPLAIYSIGIGGSTLVLLPMLEHGASLLFWLIFIVVANDVGAYFAGRKYEGPKLAQFVSPGKTISGAIGGLIAGVLVGVVYSYVFFKGLGICTPLIFCLLISIASQLGDLSESYLKRLHGAKDMGSLLPGHGGVFDRIDGLLFSAPIVLTVLVLL